VSVHSLPDSQNRSTIYLSQLKLLPPALRMGISNLL